MPITPEMKKLMNACDRFILEWPHFCKKIDFNHTFMDARAIRFLNEAPSEMKQALEKIKKGEKNHARQS